MEGRGKGGIQASSPGRQRPAPIAILGSRAEPLSRCLQGYPSVLGDKKSLHPLWVERRLFLALSAP